MQNKQIQTGKKNLAEMKIGDQVKVIAIKAHGAFNRRLRDLGIIPGVMVSVDNVAPFGDPISIRCQGMCLALRLEEARSILVDEGDAICEMSMGRGRG